VYRVARSESFWRGFACGFAPERQLLRRWSGAQLAQLDTFRDSWHSVGRCLNEALDDFATANGLSGFTEDIGTEAGGTGLGERPETARPTVGN
jgi:hypothetical protein